jgi:hypothetical protein
MKSQGHSTSSPVGTGNFRTKFSITGTILREIAHARKRPDNPGKSTSLRAPASRSELYYLHTKFSTGTGYTVHSCVYTAVPACTWSIVTLWPFLWPSPSTHPGFQAAVGIMTCHMCVHSRTVLLYTRVHALCKYKLFISRSCPILVLTGSGFDDGSVSPASRWCQKPR